jgi:FkbM family methyltransferase
MPIFNGLPLMERAARSLLNQRFRDFELIIVDNASTDGSYEYACSLTSDRRVRVERNERNIGAISNFIRTLSLARGDYFMWAPADDLWEPDFIARLVAELDAHPEAGVAMSATRRGRGDGQVKDVVRHLGRRDPSRMGPLRLALEIGSSRKCNFFINGLFRRPLLQELSRFFPDGGAPERVLLAQLALRSRFRYVDEVLYQRQLHELAHERRYPDDPYSRLVAMGVRGDLLFLRDLAANLVKSSVIPVQRKIYVPLIVCRFAATRVHTRVLGRWRRWVARRSARDKRPSRQWNFWSFGHRAPRENDKKYPRVNVLEAFGREYRFKCYSAKEVRRVKRLFTKEPGTIDWLVKTLRPDDVFYDVGANVGVYSIFAGHQMGESGRVYAFEPHLANVASLLANCEVNELRGRVHVIAIPLSNKDGFGHFHYFSLDHSLSQSQFGRTVVDGEPFQPVTSEIKYGCRIDTLIEQGLAPPPTLIKIDVDGLEGEIVEGMEVLLHSPRAPRSVQIELAEDTAEGITARMRAAGYALVSRHWSASRQEEIDAGADPMTLFPHNAIFAKCDN